MSVEYTETILTMSRGDQRSFTLKIFAADGTTPLNITGWSLWFTGKMDFADADAAAIFMLTIANGGIVVDNATGGVCTITLQPTHTNSLPDTQTKVLVEVQAKSGTTTVNTLKGGHILVNPELTRTTA